MHKIFRRSLGGLLIACLSVDLSHAGVGLRDSSGREQTISTPPSLFGGQTLAAHGISTLHANTNGPFGFGSFLRRAVATPSRMKILEPLAVVIVLFGWVVCTRPSVEQVAFSISITLIGTVTSFGSDPSGASRSKLGDRHAFKLLKLTLPKPDRSAWPSTVFSPETRDMLLRYGFLEKKIGDASYIVGPIAASFLNSVHFAEAFSYLPSIYWQSGTSKQRTDYVALFRKFSKALDAMGLDSVNELVSVPLLAHGEVLETLSARYAGNVNHFINDMLRPESPARRAVVIARDRPGEEMTSLFRIYDQYTYVADWFHARLRSARSSEPLIVLSLACSTGLEPLSLGTTLWAEWRSLETDARFSDVVRVVGVDIHPRRIQEALLYLAEGKRFDRKTGLTRNDVHSRNAVGRATTAGLISLVQQALPALREVTEFRERAVFDFDTLKLIRTADIITMNNLLCYLSESDIEKLRSYLKQMKPGAILLTLDPVQDRNFGLSFESTRIASSSIAFRRLPRVAA